MYTISVYSAGNRPCSVPDQNDFLLPQHDTGDLFPRQLAKYSLHTQYNNLS